MKKNHDDDDPTINAADIDKDKEQVTQTPPEHDASLDGEPEKEHIDITDPITNNDFPDGGYGWVITACVFFTNAVTWGINSGAFSIFLSFYQENNYFPGATTLQFTFVGGLSLSLAMAVGPVSNWIAKSHGFRTTFALGTLFLCSGQILSGFANKMWQLFLTQGVLFGFGLGFTMVSTSPISAQWFSKKRALALGIGGAGSGAGGLVFSNLTRVMLQKTSLKWAYILNGCICTAVLVPCLFLLKARNAPLKTRFQPFQVSLFKNPAFLSAVAWGMFTQLSYTVGVYTIPSYATRGLGLSQSQGSTLQALLAGGQLVLRPLCGFFLDRVGRINGAGIVTVLSGLTYLLIWMFARNFAVLGVFAFLQGALGGIFWQSNNAVLTEIIGIRDLSSGLSMLWMSIVIPATFAAPIAEWLTEYSEHTLHRSGYHVYHISIGFGGACFVVAGLALTGAKFWKQKNRRIWEKA